MLIKLNGQIESLRFAVNFHSGFKHAQDGKIDREDFTGAGGDTADGLFILRQNDFCAGAFLV